MRGREKKKRFSARSMRARDFKGVVSRVLFQVDQRDDISKPYRFRCRKPANMIPATKARVMSDGNNATQPFNINQTGDWFTIAFALAYTQESR